MENTKPKYGEVAEQIYNLVDNDKDKINAFLAAKASPEDKERAEIQRWFDNYVKPEELSDLLGKDQTKYGLVKWLADDKNNGYLDAYLDKIDSSTNQEEGPLLGADTSYLKSSIEDEDEELYNSADSGNDVSFSSNNIDDEDEIEAAMSALDGDEDLEITFEIVGDDSDGVFDDGSDEETTKKTKTKGKKAHRKKVKLNHTINRIVKDIDDEELVDRQHHEKYYVAKRDQLGTPDNLDKLEDELDKNMISYYDFPHVSIKMYESNEVKMNRIFKKLGFKFRCKDIAKYTRNWHAK